MNICIISPTSGLKRYATLSKTHLVLAHIQDEAYISFYRKRREEGDFLILDNGAHEKGESIGWNDLEYSLAIYHPQVCVLPDSLNDERKTASSSLRFLDKNVDRFPKTEWMIVPQGVNWKACFRRVIEDTRVGYLASWVGVSRYLNINYSNQRTFVAEEIKAIRPKMKLHALGMVNGSVSELEEVRSSGLFESLDTSVPVWRGWNGMGIFDPAWPEIPVDFSALHDEQGEQGKLIKSNLEAIGVDTKRLQRS